MTKDSKRATSRNDDWSVGFRRGANKGMTCDVCRCLVREKPGDAEAHRQWHASLDQFQLADLSTRASF